MNPKVDMVLNNAQQWKEEFAQLRKIILGCKLEEAVKWGQLCYVYEQKNIVLIHGFKEYCAVLFFKGALLKDPENILIQQTANVQAARQVRFTNVRDIVKIAPVLKAYIEQAIEVEKTGLKVVMKKTEDFKIPEELQLVFSKNKALKKAFEALTPGRQRAYIFHFSQPKQSKTRESRIEKCVPQILEGKGLTD